MSETYPKFLWVVAPDAKTVMSGFASKTTHFAIRAEGPFGSKEIRNIIRLLEVQQTLAIEYESDLLEEPATSPTLPVGGSE